MIKLFFVAKRELYSYFFSPVAYVFTIILLLLFGFSTFSVGNNNFFALNEASLVTFFNWHPRIYLLMIPAICMHCWSEEHRMGTIELLMTFPVKLWQLVLGKFLAAWCFINISLLLTFPMVIAVGYLGEPDYGVIFTGYLASSFMAAVFIAITMMTSAMSRRQVVSFVLAVVSCLFLMLFADESLTDFFKNSFPPALFDTLISLSITSHFATLCRGVIDFRDAFYFISMIFMPLILTGAVINSHRNGR
ncbi:MAG: ABC transporter permease subunit [Lentisphaeria bacterium]